MTYKNRRFIVFLPGFGTTGAYLRPFSRFCNENGYSTAILSYSDLGLGDIPTNTNMLAQGIATLRKDFSITHLTVVGHSLGGLIGRDLVTQGAPIDAYVSLASPHRGYRRLWGYFLPSLAAAQMAGGSDYLKALSTKPWPAHVPALFIVTARDFVVAPDHQAFSLPLSQEPSLPSLEKSRASAKKSRTDTITVDSGHIGVALTPKTWWEVYAWLTFEVLGEGPTEAVA